MLAILLDYYFMHVLALLAVSVWDDGDPDANLELVGMLLAALQGPSGSGQRFAADAGTLLLIATSHYAREAHGFAPLLDRVRQLSRPHQVRIAHAHAAALGGHLRFGREATYAGDLSSMREDNAVDYPWLRFAVTTLAAELDTAVGEPLRGQLIEALVAALSADAASLIADPVVAERLVPHRDALRVGFETFRPDDTSYSPQALFFNFSHNLLKGAVIDAMLWGDPWAVSLNDLHTSYALPSAGAAPLARRQALATTLMDYARKNPHRINGRPVPVIVYDPATGRRVLDAARRLLD